MKKILVISNDSNDENFKNSFFEKNKSGFDFNFCSWNDHLEIIKLLESECVHTIVFPKNISLELKEFIKNLIRELMKQKGVNNIPFFAQNGVINGTWIYRRNRAY